MRILERLSLRETENSTRVDVDYLRSKYEPYCEKATEILLHIYRDTPQLKELMNEAAELQVKVTKYQSFVEYTKKELDSAEYLLLDPGYEIPEAYGGGPATFFEAECASCNAFVHQHSDIMVKKKHAGKKDFILSREFQQLVSPRLKEILQAERCEGVEFRPVYTDKQEEPVLYQLVVTNVLPLLHPMNHLQVAESLGNKKKECSVCGFKSYIGKEEPPYYYSKSIRGNLTDFNRSYEYFGIFSIPITLTIVSQRVRQLFLKHKIQKARFEPIVLVDENQ